MPLSINQLYVFPWNSVQSLALYLKKGLAEIEWVERWAARIVRNLDRPPWEKSLKDWDGYFKGLMKNAMSTLHS